MSSLELETLNKTELEMALGEVLGKADEKVSLRDVTRSEYSSWYASYVVTAALSNDEERKLFLKDFGSYERPKEGMKSRRARELFVYQSLLHGAGLGTARYYGSVWKPREQRYWLFLEFVDGMPVRHLDFEYWVKAAAWLGRFHSYFAPRLEELERCPLLERYDACFFRSKADLAMRTVSQVSEDLAARLRGVLEVYDGLIDSMVSGPRTLLHGAYLPSQILADPDDEKARICPVDWELAGIGSPLYDFAFFADGFESQQFILLLDSYRRNAWGVEAAHISRTSLFFQIKCFHVFKTINWLAQGLEREFGPEKVGKLVAECQALCRSLS